MEFCLALTFVRRTHLQGGWVWRTPFGGLFQHCWFYDSAIIVILDAMWVCNNLRRIYGISWTMFYEYNIISHISSSLLHISFSLLAELWKGKPSNINFLELPLSSQHIAYCAIEGTISPPVLELKRLPYFHMKSYRSYQSLCVKMLFFYK